MTDGKRILARRLILAGLPIVVLGACIAGCRRSPSPPAAAGSPPPQPAAPSPEPLPGPPRKSVPIPPLGPVPARLPQLPPSLQVLFPDRARGILVDADRRRVLWAHDAETLAPIASMTKLMTLLLVVEAIRDRPGINLALPVTASVRAASMGGTQVWLAPGETVPLHHLVTAMMVESANDAAHAIAEAIAPDHRAATFVAMMNRRARAIGMPRARFFNANGLPGPAPQQDNQASCREMAILALELQRYPEALQWCAVRTATFRPASDRPLPMHNHNRLLGRCPGVDGLKTGFTRRAGFCITATCTRDRRRRIVAVSGFPSQRDRDRFVAALLDWSLPPLPDDTSADTGAARSNTAAQ